MKKLLPGPLFLLAFLALLCPAAEDAGVLFDFSAMRTGIKKNGGKQL